jgi:hypothetical protein
MTTDTTPLFTNEELDYAASGMSGIDVSGAFTAGPVGVSFQDIGVDAAAGGLNVDLGGAYGAVYPLLGFSSHSVVGV